MKQRSLEEDLLVTKLMDLWVVYGHPYRVNPLRYKYLMKIKRELSVCPLNAIPRYELVEYPEIPFLMIPGDLEASWYLENLNRRQLIKLEKQIIDMVEVNYAYRTMQEWIKESEQQLRNFLLSRKSRFGFDPDFSCPEQRRRRVVVIIDNY